MVTPDALNCGLQMPSDRHGPADPFAALWCVQYMVKEYLAGAVITEDKVDEAEAFVARYMADVRFLNANGFDYTMVCARTPTTAPAASARAALAREWPPPVAVPEGRLDGDRHG